MTSDRSALGGALGTVALLIKQEFVLVIVGGVFVLEAASVVIQVASFKLTGRRVFRMAPLHHHFELVGWSEPKVIARFVILAIIFALFSLTTLKLQMTAHAFSVTGRKVVVVGAARSGVAAAELLARRGASVTLTDMRDAIPHEAAAARGWRHARARRPQVRNVAAAPISIVLSPGVPPTQPAIAAARAAGVPIIGELELASRWLRGRVVAITGTKGKSTTTTLTGRMLEAGGHRVLVGGNIGHALSAQVDDSTRRHDSRRRDQQLPAGEHGHVSSVDRRAAELLARPSRSPRRHRRVRGGEGADLRQSDDRRTGRC